MSLLEIILLAVVQGITEFLPISSSGHLVVVEHLMGQTTDLADLNIVLHAGTLVSILIVYRQRVLQMLLSDWSLLSRVIVGTIPAVVVGLIVKTQFESVLESPLIAGLMLPVTGLLLFWCQKQSPTEGTLETISFRQAFWVGCAQAVAVLPGISRSGSTIAAGLAVGLKRNEAASFSFLLAIPVLCGAVLLEGLSVWKAETLALPVDRMLLGAGVAAIVGLFALKGLLKILERGSLRGMGWWCIFLGSVVVALVLRT